MVKPWKRAIVVGASSGIGAAISRRLAAEACRVALVARREAELDRIASAIREAGEEPARTYAHDVTHGAEVPGLFQAICRDLGGLDLFVYSAGVLPRLAEDEYDFEKDRRTIEVNLLGAVAWLNEAAQRFGRAGEGTIVGISSVAGERGRRGMPVYAASKAGLNVYLEALRNRLRRRGVTVVTVKPGPVDTPMTQGLDRLPMMIAADAAARRILAAARRRRLNAFVPEAWRPVMFVLRHVPSAVFSRLDV